MQKYTVYLYLQIALHVSGGIHHNSNNQLFYSRTVNLTKIKLNNEELALLNKGLQHSIEKPLNTYRINLIIETKRTIKLLDMKMQNPLWMLEAKKLKQIFISDSYYYSTQKWQVYTMKNIKTCKGICNHSERRQRKTIVIIKSGDYTENLHTFITEHKYQTLQKNPTERYQKVLGKTRQQCDLIINKKQIRHLMQKKPQPPIFNAKLKLHKPGNPIWPVINNMYAPSYKIAKHLLNKLNGCLNLSNNYNKKLHKPSWRSNKAQNWWKSQNVNIWHQH